MRKYERVWAYYVAPLLANCVDALTSLPWRILSFTQKRKASNIVMGLSIIALLGGVILAPAQSSMIMVEKSHVLSQSICSSCASSHVSTHSGGKYQKPFVFPHMNMLTKLVSDTRTPTDSTTVSNMPPKGAEVPIPGFVNVFPYGSCTWWANQRYYQLHGVFVPWRIQSNAWQWTARAYQFGWHVSRSPVEGAIIDLQPGVQGASFWAGHVAVVERILSNGHVIASNMNWGARPWRVTYIEFAPGSGVTFIYL